MPITVTSTTYSDEFNTGTSTSLNANVSDKIIATHNVYYDNTLDASLDASYQLTIGNTNNLGISSPNFDSSQGYVVFLLSSAFTLAVDIAQIEEMRGKEVTSVGFPANFTGEVLDVNSFGGDYFIVINDTTSTSTQTRSNAVLYVSSVVESAEFQYAMFGNTSGTSYVPSLIINNSNQAPIFSTDTITLDASDTVTVNTIPFKFNGAYQTGSLTVRGTGITTSGSVYNRQGFEIIHTTELTPISIYSDGTDIQPTGFSIDISNINTSSLFNSQSSTYKLQIDLKRNNLDSNGGVTEITSTSNNTGVFGQKFLGGSTNYSYSNFSIVRTSDSEATDNVLIDVKFTVSFDIENTVDTPFSNSNTKVKVGIENIPEVIDNGKNYEGAFLYDHAITTLGAGAIAGEAVGIASSITNYTATFNSSSSISVSFDVEFTSGAKTDIKTNSVPYFSIFAETQNHTLDYTNSDRVVLQTFEGTAIDDIPFNPITINNTQFITAPYDDFSTGIDNTEIDGFPVQLMVANCNFTVDYLSLNPTEFRWTDISQLFVLKNSVTNEEIELEKTSFSPYGFTDSFIGYVIPDGRVINRGYKIPDSEIRNQVKLELISYTGSQYTYEVTLPFFVRWEYYKQIILNEIPETIIDTNEPFNGANYFVHRIDSLANWDLNYSISIDSVFRSYGTGSAFLTTRDDFSIDYSATQDYLITTTDYNSHPDITNRSIKSYSEDGLTELVNGSEKFIDSSEKTLIVVEWTMNYTPSAISDFECEFYIEGFENGSPTKIQRISSINQLLSSSWFTSIDGSGLIEKSIDGNKFVGKAYINNNTLANFDNYRLYPTFYSPKRPTEYLLVENGDNLVAENGDKFIRDF